MINVGGEWLASQRVMGEESPPFASPPACRATKFSRRPQGRGVGVDRGALRWPWGGGSGEAQLGLGSGGREGWGLGAEAQMMEDPARDERVGEGGDAVAAAAARGLHAKIRSERRRSRARGAGPPLAQRLPPPAQPLPGQRESEPLDRSTSSVRSVSTSSASIGGG